MSKIKKEWHLADKEGGMKCKVINLSDKFVRFVAYVTPCTRMTVEWRDEKNLKKQFTYQSRLLDACTVKLYYILEVKNALVQSVRYFTDYAICNLCNYIFIKYVKWTHFKGSANFLRNKILKLLTEFQLNF